MYFKCQCDFYCGRQSQHPAASKKRLETDLRESLNLGPRARALGEGVGARNAAWTVSDDGLAYLEREQSG